MRFPGFGFADDLLDARLVERQFAHLLHDEGVLGCALVELASGALIASEQRDDALELAPAAVACAGAMRALPGVDELTVTVGAQQRLMRALPRRPGVFLLALVDRDRANLALARARMADAQNILA